MAVQRAEVMEAFLQQYGSLGVFLGAAFEGQTAVVVGGVLARQHLIPAWLVLLSATSGSAIVDHLLFAAGRYYRSHRLVVRAQEKPAFARALGFITRFPVSYILAFRFILGLRLASPIAIGVSRVPAWQFAMLNAAGALVWSFAFTAVGFLFGEALERLSGRQQAAVSAAFVAAGLVAVSIGIWAVRRWRAQQASASRQ